MNYISAEAVELAIEMCSDLKNMSDAGAYDDFIREIASEYDSDKSFDNIWNYVKDHVTIHFSDVGSEDFAEFTQLPRHASTAFNIVVVNNIGDCHVTVPINTLNMVVNNTLYLRFIYGAITNSELMEVHRQLLKFVLTHVAYLLVEEREGQDARKITATRRGVLKAVRDCLH